MLQKRWNIKENSDPKAVLVLADSLNIPLVLAELLITRDVTNYFEAKTYFRPSLDTLYDPFLMDGMEAASNRVISAITSNEKIYIYGDYDVDGTCAVAILLMFLKELGSKC